MIHIYVVFGSSGVGKDTLVDNTLKTIKEKEIALDVEKVIPYTTRKPRSKESEGTPYHFINDKELNSIRLKCKEDAKSFSELQTYTMYEEDENGNQKPVQVTYMTKLFDLEDGHSYIVISQFNSYYSIFKGFMDQDDVKVCGILCHVPQDIRLTRMISRERKNGTGNYIELCRRFISDEEELRCSTVDSLKQMMASCVKENDKIGLEILKNIYPIEVDDLVGSTYEFITVMKDPTTYFN